MNKIYMVIQNIKSSVQMIIIRRKIYESTQNKDEKIHIQFYNFNSDEIFNILSIGFSAFKRKDSSTRTSGNSYFKAK